MKKPLESVVDDTDLEVADSVALEMRYEAERLRSVLKPIVTKSRKEDTRWRREYDRVINLQDFVSVKLTDKVPNIMSAALADSMLELAEEISRSLRFLREDIKRYRHAKAKEDRAIAKYKPPTKRSAK